MTLRDRIARLAYGKAIEAGHLRGGMPPHLAADLGANTPEDGWCYVLKPGDIVFAIDAVLSALPVSPYLSLR